MPTYLIRWKEVSPRLAVFEAPTEEAAIAKARRGEYVAGTSYTGPPEMDPDSVVVDRGRPAAGRREGT